MTMSKDERYKLTEALRPDFDKPMPSPYYFTPNQAAALIIAARFVLTNGGMEDEEIKHLRSALMVFKG